MPLTFASLVDFARKTFGLPPKARLVSKEMPEHRLRYMLKSEVRDFVFRAESSGAVSAHCKFCNSPMVLAPQGPLLWFTCHTCHRHSFSPLANAERDVRFAIADRAPFEYAMFFVDKIPPGLHPPE